MPKKPKQRIAVTDRTSDTRQTAAKEPSINTGRAGKGLGTSRPRPGVRKVTLYFSDAEWTAVRRAAFELDSTFTNVVRKAVKDQLGVE